MIARALLVGPLDSHFQELKVFLEQAGVSVRTAKTGTDGLVVGCEFQPHLIVAELLLSGIDGLDFSARITKAEGFATRVILYTQAFRDEKSRREAIEKVGAVHYFVKPFQKNALWKSVTEILSEINSQGEDTNVKKIHAPSPRRKSRKKIKDPNPGDEASDLERSAIEANLRKTLTQPADKSSSDNSQAKRRNRRVSILESTLDKEGINTESYLLERPLTEQSPPGERLRNGENYSSQNLQSLSGSEKSIQKPSQNETPISRIDSSPNQPRMSDMRPWWVVENSSRVGNKEQGAPSADTVTTTERIHAPRVSGDKKNRDSELNQFTLQPDLVHAPENERGRTPMVKTSEAIPDSIHGELGVAWLRNFPLFNRSPILIGGITVLVVFALTLTLQFLMGPQESPANSNPIVSPPQLSESTKKPLDDNISEAPPKSSLLDGPLQLGSEASKAMMRWLKQMNPRHSTSYLPGDGRESSKMVVPTDYMSTSPSNLVQLMISDISPTDRQPFQGEMVPPSLSNSVLRAMGHKPYLVGVEIDPKGTVTSTRLMTPDAENSFPSSILDTVRTWRFVPRDESQKGVWIKYFTFRAQPNPETH